MAKNENKERTGKLTKHDLLSILAVLAGAFCYGLANGLGWFDWIYNLNPMLKDWMGFILVVMCLLISRAVSAIYCAIRKKKEK